MTKSTKKENVQGIIASHERGKVMLCILSEYAKRKECIQYCGNRKAEKYLIVGIYNIKMPEWGWLRLPLLLFIESKKKIIVRAVVYFS